jgi:hypothetical protein
MTTNTKTKRMSVGDCSVTYPIGVASTNKSVRGKGYERVGDVLVTVLI